MNKCPNCKKTFVDISEGWREILGCPKCGLHKADAERVTQNQTQRTPNASPKAPAKPVARSSDNSDFDWMKRLTLKMAREHGFDYTVALGTAWSWHKAGRIRYGSRDIKDTKANGMREYATWARYVWSDTSPIRYVKNAHRCTDMTGRKGLWGVVLHEFGHAVARENGDRVRGSIHNYGWADAVKELKVLYPFCEVSTL